jgi:hypothetical protein
VQNLEQVLHEQQFDILLRDTSASSAADGEPKGMAQTVGPDSQKQAPPSTVADLAASFG